MDTSREIIESLLFSIGNVIVSLFRKIIMAR